jgi:hypothetical protein
MNKEDLLQKYFKNTLSQKEGEHLKSLLETDADFKASFEEYNNFNLAFKSHEAGALKSFLKSLDSTDKLQQLKWYKNTKIIYLAAAILVIALCIPFLVKPDMNNVFNDYYDVYPNVEKPIVRGAEETEINSAFKAYEANNYSLAVDAFQNLLEEDNNPNYRFYYAMSLLNNDQSDLALEELSQLENIDFDYQNEVLWYKALIHLKNNENKQAIAKLNELENSESSFKSKERKVLLQQLKDN